MAAKKRKYKRLTFYQRKKKVNMVMVKEFFSYLCIALFAIFLAAILTYTLGLSTNVIGVSMEPALSNGQTIYINRFAYTLTTPKEGDVIVFLPNGNQNSHYYVKRVIAGPNDKLQIIGGICFVNGSESPYITTKIWDAGIAENEIVLDVGEYFCIGDNPNNSEDSRSANIGPVELEDIIGKAWFRMKGKNIGMGFIK